MWDRVEGFLIVDETQEKWLRVAAEVFPLGFVGCTSDSVYLGFAGSLPVPLPLRTPFCFLSGLGWSSAAPYWRVISVVSCDSRRLLWDHLLVNGNKSGQSLVSWSLACLPNHFYHFVHSLGYRILSELEHFGWNLVWASRLPRFYRFDSLFYLCLERGWVSDYHPSSTVHHHCSLGPNIVFALFSPEFHNIWFFGQCTPIIVFDQFHCRACLLICSLYPTCPLFIGMPRICNFVVDRLDRLCPFSEMLPSVKFAEDKVLVSLFSMKNAKIVQL